MRKLGLALALVTVLFPRPAAADVEEDKTAIRQTALDYIESWYTGDATRLEQALHPDLVKRIVIEENGKTRLESMSAMGLMLASRSGWGTRTPLDQQRKEIEILDLIGDVASVKVTARDWVDYLHLAKLNGRWVIVNILERQRLTQHP